MKSKLVIHIINGNDSLWHATADDIMANIRTAGNDYIEMNRWYGQYYNYQGKYQKAIPFLKLALKIEIKKGYVHSARYSTLCFLLSQCFEELGEYTTALLYMAKNVGFDSYNEKSMIQHILKSNKYTFVTALRCANIYHSQFKRTGDKSLLQKSKIYLDALDSIMFKQFKVVEENAILQFYLESGQQYFHLGMDIHYELWIKTGDQKYLISFVKYSDKNKNSLMYRDVQMAHRQINLSDEIIQKEFKLRATIKDEKRKGLKDNKIFNKLIDEYSLLEDEIEINYKSFITDGLVKETVNLDSIKHNLNENKTCLLIIDETLDFWYYTLMDPKSIIIERLPIKKENVENIDSFLISLQNNQIHHLANVELLPKNILSSLSERILYIPDGFYHRFPLSALLENEKHNVKLLPSISLFKRFLEPLTKPKSSAFFAFSDLETIKSKLRTRLNELPGTYKEVNRLSKGYQNAIIYTGKNATKSNFIKAYQDTNIQFIHLALHGLANSAKKDDVKLYFRTSEGGLDSLYGYELLRYKSKCKKIVLSACQSGLGAYQKGEGLFSLPRYFMINGATDVVFNYWDVED
jgi:CHAT domain-containing protein